MTPMPAAVSHCQIRWRLSGALLLGCHFVRLLKGAGHPTRSCIPPFHRRLSDHLQSMIVMTSPAQQAPIAWHFVTQFAGATLRT
jgi:hypothetical protein